MLLLPHVSLRQRTLLRALEIVGDEATLARKLQAPRVELRAWLHGTETPPTAAFLAAVDIVEYCVAAVDYGSGRAPLPAEL
jgi:hypothetical protein